VTTTDVVVFGAMLAQPLSNASGWDAIARRQKQLSLRSVATHLPMPASQSSVRWSLSSASAGVAAGPEFVVFRPAMFMQGPAHGTVVMPWSKRSTMTLMASMELTRADRVQWAVAPFVHLHHDPCR
jgi:hypothetical protein